MTNNTSHEPQGAAAPPPNGQRAQTSAPRYGYFVLQTRSAPDRVSGVVENLATGEKRPFESTDDLAALLKGWGDRGRSVP